jgi:RHS repeat-associated protein
VGTLKFINGTFNITSGNVRGPWASGLVVQFTLNGTTWVTATGWTLSPSYSYTNTTAGVEYTFTGTPIANVKGMRVSGRTWQTAGQSKRVRVREVKVFANQNAVGRGAGKVWAKPAVLAPPEQGTPPKLCERYGIVADNCKATTYYHFGSQRVAMREQTDGNPTGAVYWLHSDHLGSASLATNANGGEVPNSAQRYKPFGELRVAGSGQPSKYTFTGHYDFMAFGLIDMKARMYSPLLGRFLSADTIVPGAGNPQALNRYSIVFNNPHKYVDPDGHVPILLVVFFVVVAVAATGDSAQPSPPPPNYPINDYGGDKCTLSLPDCFGDKVFLKDFAGHDEKNPIPIEEFEAFADKVANDLYTHDLDWPGFFGGRQTYDTPFYNGGESQRRSDDPNAVNGIYPATQRVCIENVGCAGRSEINYIAQGMWAAAVGEPQPVSAVIVIGWKLWEYKESPSENTLFWLNYGYEYYQRWHKKNRQEEEE